MSPFHTSAFAFAAILLGAAPAIAEVALGTKIDAAELPTAQGGRAPLLVPGKVNVLVFFRPTQEHSTAALAQLAGVQKEIAPRPIAWAGIASDRFPATEIAAAVQAAGFTGPALVDAGDELYGKLEVRLHPVVLVVGKDRAIAAYQPFTKLDFGPIVKARVLHALKEIDDAALQKVLSPPAALQGGEVNVARRYLKMGERLLAAGDHARALDSANKSLEHNPQLAAAHALKGNALAAQGDCAEAVKSFEAALALDAQDPGALEGKKRCAGK